MKLVNRIFYINFLKYGIFFIKYVITAPRQNPDIIHINAAVRGQLGKNFIKYFSNIIPVSRRAISSKSIIPNAKVLKENIAFL